MPASKWNYLKAMEEARKYASVMDFKQYSRGAYEWCLRFECLKEATEHYPPQGCRRRHTEDQVRQLADQCATVKEFREANPRSYIAASKHGFLRKITDEIRKRGQRHSVMAKLLKNKSIQKGNDYEG
jgi:hypothetical protein